MRKMYKNKMHNFRKEKGITLAQLSEKTGISTGYLCHLERQTRKNPSSKVMDKIAKGLGKTVYEVFFE